MTRVGQAADSRDAGYEVAAPVRSPFSLHLSERKLLLFLADLIVVNTALVLWLAWRFGVPVGREVIRDAPLWFGVLTGLWIVVSFLLDAYDLRRAARFRTGVTIGAAVATATGLIFLAIPRYTPPLPTSRIGVYLFLVLLAGGVAAWRGCYALLLVRPWFRRKALIVGAGVAGRTLAEAVRTHAAAEYDLVGFVDDDSSKQLSVIEGVRVLGGTHNLQALIEQTGASELIVAITHADRISPSLFQTIMDCHERGVQVKPMATLYEELTGRVAVEYAGNDLHVILPLNSYPARFDWMVRWARDLTIGVIGLVLTLLLLPMVALAQRIEGLGPIFYTQRRVGRGGRHFDLLKFRTMRSDAEANGPQWARERDHRVTRLGRLIRRLHIDEIPQAVNILRGELSFIGPRPERPEFVAQLEKQIPFYRARHAVKPGVTGWAQINYRYGASVEDALIKLQYDLYYIKHQSLWLDLVILIKTLVLVVTLRGR